jgi:hypothetical protein
MTDRARVRGKAMGIVRFATRQIGGGHRPRLNREPPGSTLVPRPNEVASFSKLGEARRLPSWIISGLYRPPVEPTSRPALFSEAQPSRQQTFGSPLPEVASRSELSAQSAALVALVEQISSKRGLHRAHRVATLGLRWVLFEARHVGLGVPT